MIITEKSKKQGKVLSFEKNSEFFFKRGLSKLDKNDLLEAICNYRRALLCEPDSEEIVMAIAEVLAQMGRYADSNRLIFMHFPDADARPNECFFGLGCNFTAMKEYENARACLEQYITNEPNGEFVYEACDMLDILDEVIDVAQPDEQGDDLRIIKKAPRDIPDMIDILIPGNDDRYSVSSVEKLIEEYPELYYMRNALALKLYLAHDLENAFLQIQEVFKVDPDNIHAHCNLAVLRNHEKDYESVEKEIEFLKNAQTEDMGELNRIAITFMELGNAYDAYPILKRMYMKDAYNTGIIHKLAICAYSLGDYKRAISCYDRLIKIDDRDSVARFYREVCLRAQISGSMRAGLMLDYEVPMDEIVTRIKRIKKYLEKPRAELLKLWQEGGEFERLILWGTKFHDHGIKRTMLNLIAEFGDRKAELTLREFLLREPELDQIKREVFALLNQMHAREPYLSMIDGELVESRVSMLEFMQDVPKPYRDVVTLCVDHMDKKCSSECIFNAAQIWKNYIGSLGAYPSMNKDQTLAMAVVLEYFAVNRKGDKVTKADICREYGISSVRFDNAYAKLKPFAGKN